MPHSNIFIKDGEMDWEQVGEGVRRKILGFDDGLMMARVLFKKGAVGALHHHPHRQVSYVESGSFEVEISGEKAVLKTGDSYFVPPEALHGAVALTDGSLLDIFVPARDDFLKA